MPPSSAKDRSAMNLREQRWNCVGIPDRIKYQVIVILENYARRRLLAHVCPEGRKGLSRTGVPILVQRRAWAHAQQCLAQVLAEVLQIPTPTPGALVIQ